MIRRDTRALELDTPLQLRVPARPPAIANAIPPAISTALMIGDTRSLWLVWMPMFTSPALMPCVSLLGMGTIKDAIPNTITIRPAISSIFIWLLHGLKNTLVYFFRIHRKARFEYEYRAGQCLVRSKSSSAASSHR